MPSHGPLKLFAGSSHPGLARAIAGHLKVPLGKLKVKVFSNQNIKVKIEENVRGADVFVIQTSTPPLSDHIMELLILIDALKFASANRITAVLPNFPYARSDKKDEPRISVTARLMGDLLQAAGADRVLTMTLHSPQTMGFLRIPVDQLLATPILKRHFLASDLKNTVVVATDAGAGKIADAFANQLRLPMAVIDKRRDDDSEAARAAAVIGDVRGKRAIIYDDEIATGGSIEEAAAILRKFGVRHIRVGVTHPVFSGPVVERLTHAKLDELVVTDTLPVPQKTARALPALKVLSTAKLFADAIRSIHTDSSVAAIMRGRSLHQSP
jgi:ribose-phosphate pyrophosphokinase